LDTEVEWIVSNCYDCALPSSTAQYRREHGKHGEYSTTVYDVIAIPAAAGMFIR